MKLHVVIITIKENPALSCLHDCNVEPKTRAKSSSQLEPKARLCLHIIAWIISYFSSDSANSLAPGRITSFAHSCQADRLTWNQVIEGTTVLGVVRPAVTKEWWSGFSLLGDKHRSVVGFFFSLSLDSRWIDCFSSSGCHPFHASGVCSDVRD